MSNILGKTKDFSGAIRSLGANLWVKLTSEFRGEIHPLMQQINAPIAIT